MWPPESPLKIQSIRNGVQAASAATRDDDRGGREDPQRLVHRVGAEDREGVAADVRPGRREEPRLAQLLVGADLDVVDRDEHLARLDQALERVGEAGDDLERDRRLAVVGAKAGGRVGDVGARGAPHDPAAEPLQQLLRGREVLDRLRRRSPTTRSASPARIGATSFGMSAARYWLSASVLTITSAPSFSAASSPAWKAFARPRLLVSRTTWSTPCSRATATVRSVEPSSITSHSTSSKPSSSRGSSASVRGSVASSLKHGIWMISFMAAPSMAVPFTASA